MTIDWHHFTPFSALFGGVLIGLSAALLILFNGRIAGISGILGGLLTANSRRETYWRAAFLFGILVAPLIHFPISGHAIPTIHSHWGILIISGLLVGFGARLGSGCTSGHGVCGIARLSPRSIVATLIFMSTGGLTVFVIRHILS